MATATEAVESARGEDTPVMVDPRAPRFGQSITTLGLIAGIVLGIPALVYGVALVLLVPVLSRWRYDPYAVVWRNLIRPVVGAPDAPEPASPHRFAKLLGAVGTTLASALLLAGFPLAGYAVAAGVAAAAGLAAATSVCIGCRMYRQVAFFRRLDLV